MWTVTLTFDLQTWVLYATYHLVMVNIVQSYFKIPQCMAKLQPGHVKCQYILANMCELELCSTDIVPVRDIPPCHGEHVFQVLI